LSYFGILKKNEREKKVAKQFTICDGAVISEQDVGRIEAALEKLKEDKGASHELTVSVTLHLHHEYPKTLYKGKQTRAVHNADEQAAAAKDGFGRYDHQAFTMREA
jgi:hypothetical protein